MGITTVTSSELFRHLGWVKKAAARGPVFITKRGRLAFVAITIEEYIRIGGSVVTEPPLVESDSMDDTD